MSQSNNPQAYTDEQRGQFLKKKKLEDGMRANSKEKLLTLSVSQPPHSLLEGDLAQECKSLIHVGTPPTGELGALSHLDSFVSSGPHSSLSSRCSSSCLDVPFGDEVPNNHQHQHHSPQPPKTQQKAAEEAPQIPRCKTQKTTSQDPKAKCCQKSIQKLNQTPSPQQAYWR